MAKKIVILISVVSAACLFSLASSRGAAWLDPDETSDEQFLQALLGQTGEPVIFSYSDEYERERRIVARVANIEPVLGPDVEAQETRIGIALKDLNNSGKTSILAYVNDPGYCGATGRCTFIILIRANDAGWNLALDTLADENGISLLPTSSYGYRYLCANAFRFGPDQSAESKSVLRFFGHKYNWSAMTESQCDYRRQTEGPPPEADK